MHINNSKDHFNGINIKYYSLKIFDFLVQIIVDEQYRRKKKANSNHDFESCTFLSMKYNLAECLQGKKLCIKI